MPNKISNEMVERLAGLTKLSLSDEEKKKAGNDLEEMLCYIDKLNELDTEHIPPTYQIHPTVNVFREDILTNHDFAKEALSNAPSQREQSFVAPKTIGREEI